jgi:hypothetical protein
MTPGPTVGRFAASQWAFNQRVTVLRPGAEWGVQFRGSRAARSTPRLEPSLQDPPLHPEPAGKTITVSAPPVGESTESLA